MIVAVYCVRISTGGTYAVLFFLRERDDGVYSTEISLV